MPVITLPKFPKDKEFEEFIAAHFNAAGLYVDRNLLLRRKTKKTQSDVLELDVYTTDYSIFPPKMSLIEIKSGGWGTTDIFKIRGWLDYLSLDHGFFIASCDRQERPICEKIASSLNIDILVGNTPEKAANALSTKMQWGNIDERDITTWRFSYWLEQCILEDLKHKKKSHKDTKRYKVLDDYIFEINNGTFFSPTIANRVDRLYEKYRQNPRISAKCSHEAAGESFDEEYDRCTQQSYTDTFYKAKNTDLQISTYVEHRARLAILKATVDYCLYEKVGDYSKLCPIVKILGKDISLEFGLPNNFINSVKGIENQPFFNRYPVFWQWFLWVFGGFILLDKQEEEYGLLSKKTGIPVEHIDQALSSYDALFPINDSWFINTNSRIKMLKMFPVPFNGVGINYRRYYYCPSGKFEEIQLSHDKSHKDITKWNNLACNILRSGERYRNSHDSEGNSL